MKLEDNVNMLGRRIRLRSMKGTPHNPSWIDFRISNDGTILFNTSESSLSCILCGNPILGDPLVFLEMPFDRKVCLDTYRKLLNVYGRNVSELGLPEVVNLNFFYVDIVGLSNPSLSVNKQVTKIIVLNRLITSCDAFSKSAKDRKIIFPTGDGMSIGFLSNMELPLQLSIELHKKLRAYNSEKKDEDVVNVRIGLNRGPVFLVTDLNGNHDLWGPGIILTRRVMDLGDSNHILLEGDFAEELIQLRDDYKTILYPIGKYQIKHGQELRLYSAHSNNFGNSVPPAKR
jgi:class 3 adenylate cyclase